MNATAEPIRQKFAVTRGCHVDNDPSGRKQPDGRPVEVMYKAGDVVESEIDLVERFGDKFQRVEENPRYVPAEPETAEQIEARIKADQARLAAMRQAPNPNAVADAARAGFKGDTLDKMSDKELRSLAGDEEIDVSKCKTRDDLLKTIRAAGSK